MGLDIVVAFFLLGTVAGLLRVKLPFPDSLYDTLTLLLMLTIGLKGGMALSQHGSGQLLGQSLAVIAFGAALPLLAYPVLRFFGQLDRINAAAIAAHYGSVSVATYAVAVAVLESQQIAYEAWLPLFVVLLEMPAIVVGILLAKGINGDVDTRKLAHETLLSPGIVLMTGGLLIGAWGGSRVDDIAPLFFTLFHGALALFLLKMGLVAAAQLQALKENGAFLAAFGVFMPLMGGLGGALVAALLGLSVGGTTLLAVLGASASYIAVPAAMRLALPEANGGLSISASLGITFPFNVMVGIPLYLLLAQKLAA